MRPVVGRAGNPRELAGALHAQPHANEVAGNAQLERIGARPTSPPALADRNDRTEPARPGFAKSEHPTRHTSRRC